MVTTTVNVSTTPHQSSSVPNLTESGEQNTWIGYAAGIVVGVLLVEIILLLVVVICRIQQVRKKENEEGHVYIVRKYTRRDSNSSESNPWANCVNENAPFQDKPAPSQIDTTSLTPAVRSPHECTPYELNTMPLGAIENIDNKKEGKQQEPQQLLPHIMVSDQAEGYTTGSSVKDVAEDRTDHSQHSELSSRVEGRQIMSSKPKNSGKDEAAKTSSNDDEERYVSTRVQQLKETPGAITEYNMRICNEPAPLDIHKSGVDDVERAYEELDELEKQIHILSQSIPTLDLYGQNQDMTGRKRRPMPKASRSIPTMLDSAGYEEPDAIRPKKTQALFKRQFMKAEKDAQLESSPTLLVPMPAVKSLAGEEAHKIPYMQLEEIKKTTKKEPVYSVVQKKTKASSVANLASESAETPPPVPPQTAEALYMAATVSNTPQKLKYSDGLSRVDPYAQEIGCHAYGSDPNISHGKTDHENNRHAEELADSIIHKLPNDGLYIDL